jgi:hypothetical protein
MAWMASTRASGLYRTPPSGSSTDETGAHLYIQGHSKGQFQSHSSDIEICQPRTDARGAHLRPRATTRVRFTVRHQLLGAQPGR